MNKVDLVPLDRTVQVHSDHHFRRTEASRYINDLLPSFKVLTARPTHAVGAILKQIVTCG